MNYDIKIMGDESDNGLLEFDRLNQITQTTKEIAIKAFMLRYRGFSDIKPDKSILPALAIKLKQLSGDSDRGTTMVLDCNSFEDHIKAIQLNAFNTPEHILKQTPMALVIESFRAALIDNEDKNSLDKPLLKTLMKFKRNFISESEVFYFSNRNTIPEIRITKDDFKKIESIEEAIPEPHKVIINGELDEMKVSKSKLGLITKEGLVNIFANDNSIISGITGFLGKEITITGKAHFKPGGQLSFIDIESYHTPGEKDSFFSRKPLAMNVEQQLMFQLQQNKKKNPFADILGQWPGDETDEEFQQLLKDIG